MRKRNETGKNSPTKTEASQPTAETSSSGGSTDQTSADQVQPPVQPTQPVTPEQAKQALSAGTGVLFTSRFSRYRLTIDPGAPKKPPTVIQFEAGKARVSDPALIERALAHPLFGIEFQKVA